MLVLCKKLSLHFSEKYKNFRTLLYLLKYIVKIFIKLLKNAFYFNVLIRSQPSLLLLLNLETISNYSF